MVVAILLGVYMFCNYARRDLHPTADFHSAKKCLLMADARKHLVRTFSIMLAFSSSSHRGKKRPKGRFEIKSRR